jgi:hypothetical protein
MARKTPEPAAARRSKAPPPAAAKVAAPESTAAQAMKPQAQKPDGSNFTPRPTAAVTPSGEPAGNHSPQDRIAARAYLKWLARGCPIGDDKRDWFEAQEEVLREPHSG